MKSETDYSKHSGKVQDCYISKTKTSKGHTPDLWRTIPSRLVFSDRTLFLITFYSLARHSRLNLPTIMKGYQFQNKSEKIHNNGSEISCSVRKSNCCNQHANPLVNRYRSRSIKKGAHIMQKYMGCVGLGVPSQYKNHYKNHKEPSASRGFHEQVLC